MPHCSKQIFVQVAGQTLHDKFQSGQCHALLRSLPKTKTHKFLS